MVDRNRQEGLFPDPPATPGLGLIDADVVYRAGFIPAPDRDRLLADLIGTTAWQEDTFRIYGREVPVPRLIAWYGDPGRDYGYSRIVLAPEPWTPALLEIKAAVEAEAGSGFNSVLLNYYRDGRDSVAWHSDDEPELGPEPVIASVSFGATRKFQLRHRSRPDLRHTLELTHGSLLTMRGPTQRCWQHQVPKTARAVGPRINLTFRTVAEAAKGGKGAARRGGRRTGRKRATPVPDDLDLGADAPARSDGT